VKVSHLACQAASSRVRVRNRVSVTVRVGLVVGLSDFRTIEPLYCRHTIIVSYVCLSSIKER